MDNGKAGGDVVESFHLGKPKRDVVYYLTIRKPGRQEEEHESVKDLSLAEDAEKCESWQF